jgi:Cu2+-exporting ATPase
MCKIIPRQPRVLHALPGRVRLHLSGWSGEGRTALEDSLRRVPGVQYARANSLTGNVVIHFDPRAVDLSALLGRVSWANVSAGPVVKDQAQKRHGTDLPAVVFKAIGLIADVLAPDPLHLVLACLGVVTLLARLLHVWQGGAGPGPLL